MNKNTATLAPTLALEQTQKTCHEGLDKAMSLNLDTLQAAGKAHLAFIGTLSQAKPDQNSFATLAQATQSYFREAQERTQAYFHASMALAKDVGTKLHQVTAA